MANITFENVTKRYGDVTAVSNLNLEVLDKEFLVLLGPSGCGKTTTMRMIAGLETISEGTLRIGGVEVNNVLPKYRNVAMVFQNYALYPHMTVAENIGYPLRVRKVPKEERRKTVEEAARTVELGELLDRYPRQLSGGQRQRVALARAIIRRPTVFLMDEPLSNLDAKLRIQMRAELKHLQRELATTTVYVTHDQIEAMTLADRVAVMDEGVIKQLGPPKTIYSDPDNIFVAGFIGSPGMNLTHGELHDGTFVGAGFTVPGVGGGNHRAAVLGVRPEDLRIVGAGEGHLRAPLYSVELTGESTLLTVRTQDVFVIIRTDKDFTGEVDSEIEVAVNLDKAFLFGADTGERIRV